MAKKRTNGEGNIRKRKDGRWEGRYTAGYDQDGKRIIKNVLGRTQAEVKAKLSVAIAESQQLDVSRSGEYTVAEWLHLWFELYAKPNIRPSTAGYYRRAMEEYTIPRIGTTKLNKLTNREIQKLYKDLLENGRLRKKQRKKHPGLSGSTVRGVHIMLHNALDRAVKERLLIRNPADSCVVPKVQHQEMKTLQPEDLKAYLDAAERRNALAMFYLELVSGIRKGELVALRWEDLNIAEKTISVSKQATKDEAGNLVVTRPKTENSIRQISIPQEAVELLVKEHAKHPSNLWLFPSSRTGGMYHPDSVATLHQRILKDAGLEHLRFHDLRHTFATMALENGMDIKTLSAMLGHVSAATTLDIYTHITGDMLSEAAAKIDRGLGNKVAEDTSEAAQNPLADFKPVMRRIRKPGTGCINELNDHLFEGRYSPTWPDGTKHSKCVYAHTREECEEKLKVLIQQMNAERKRILDRLRGIVSPDKLTKKQRQIWEYLRLHPDETNYSIIARGAKVTRHTVAKHYEMVREMLGFH